ncbi:hypothetical protein [Streptomyces altiplanensis]
MTNTKEHAKDTCPLLYQCRLPLSTRTVNHLADLLRRHLKAIRSRWRILPPGKIAVITLAVLRHDQRLADMAGGNNVSESTVRRRRDELIGLLAAQAPRLDRALKKVARQGREVVLNRRTVSKYARAHTWQEVVRRPPRKPSTLDPYLGYLQQRWDEGQHSAKILHEELQAKGYLGHYQRVKMAVAPLRRGLPVDEPRERPPSPREAVRWITTHPHRRSPHINDRLPRLLDHCPELKAAHDLVRRFAAMLDNRDATSLPERLDDLANTGLAPPTGLAGALREDRHAVAQGIATPYNSGVNEGRITDVKLQKRLMAGRADVSLLRQRAVLIAHLRHRYADRPTVSPR